MAFDSETINRFYNLILRLHKVDHSLDKLNFYTSIKNKRKQNKTFLNKLSLNINDFFSKWHMF